MHHLILGYGYCAYYLAQVLLEQGESVTAISRHLDLEYQIPSLEHRSIDLQYPFIWEQPDTIVYYFIPPPNSGDNDSFLNHLLQHSTLNAQKIIYFGSSAVYGDQQGRWVNEETRCNPQTAREHRRLHAEQLWQGYCEKNAIPYCLLRIAGIYGPNRLPIAAAQARTPVIRQSEAPFTNTIYVNDLVRIANVLATTHTPFNIYNIADGEPHPMGYTQQLVAQALSLMPAPEASWEDVFEQASPLKKEFLKSSKRLCIQRLQNTLGDRLKLNPLDETIQQEINQYYQRTTATD